MTDTADVVIVGAGIMGVSTAYHLARRRAGRVVVVERDGICEGSTALASGGIRHQYANRIGIELTLNVIETFERFEDEFGVDPQFRQHGYLILAATEAELALARRNLALQRSLGVDVTLLSPEETRRRFPYLDTERPARGVLLAARWLCRPVPGHDGDGRAGPRAGRRDSHGHGGDGRAPERHAGRGRDDVGGRDRRAGRRPRRRRVVGGRRTAGRDRRAGAPAAALEVHHRAVSFERIPEATPFIIDTHQGISMRREGAGLLLGIGRRDDAPSFDTHPDWSLTEPLVERAVHRAPALADASLMRGWAGLYEMTPDQTGILSAVPEVEGLHVIAGFSGHGFMHGPIAGRLMAELIADGRATTVDIAPLALGRFARGELAVEPLTFT